MINKNNSIFDRDMMRENIHECCQKILARSPRILEFILSKAHKNEVPSQKECESFHELRESPVLLTNVNELWLTLNGRPYYLTDFLQQNERVVSTLSSIARPIFMEEAQMILQNQECIAPNNSSNLQHNQQAPSLEQTQYTITGDETRDSDNDLSDL
ncbi:hypothetical protein [Candidatus Fokinia crypta]|uniref:Stringent starvation protein B n=1 Tax=Candidatus Fokinia crypta TaxID=1920990 RepID=A0ABZ0UQV6_9RICK|nr:hypothetical protein [Candidatus Fokinia cryptica]WPX97952.1 hypothetical protein Fokcrypt_00477 [Candidatus Fokinia cryptica]